ncbi:MAG: hypothetical protein ABIU97_00630, partial [Dehalococcoidia bacterium]
MTLQADLIAKRQELAVKRTVLAGLFADANKETDPVKRDEIATSIKSANLELADLVDAVAPLQEMVEAEKANSDALKSLRAPVGRQIQPENEDVDRTNGASDDVLTAGFKSVRAMFANAMEANNLKSFHGFRGEFGELAVKTLITSADMTPLE